MRSRQWLSHPGNRDGLPEKVQEGCRANGRARGFDRELFLPDQPLEVALAEDFDAQFFRLVELAAGVLARHHVTSFFRDAAGRLAAQLLDEALDLVPAVLHQRASHHERFAGQVGGPLRPRLALLRQFDAEAAQLVHDLAAGGALEIVEYALRQNRADAVNPAQPIHRRFHQLVDAAELLGQYLGHVLADVGDRQPGQHAGQATVLAGRDAVEQVLGRLLPHPLQLQERIHLQAVNVRDRFDQPGVHELVHDLDAHAFDVHRVPLGERPQLPLEPGDTLRTGAAVEDALVVALDRGAAHRALG